MGDNDKYAKLTPYQNTKLGMYCGSLEVMLLQPILYLKNATQQRLPLTLNPRYLYRGLSSSIANMGALTAIQFPLTSTVKKVMLGGNATKRKLTDFEKISASFTGGFLSGIVCTPIELVMIQQQRNGGTILRTPSQIIKTYGGSKLMRGLLPSCVREGFWTCAYLGVGPVLSSRLQSDYNFNLWQAKIGGSIIGGIFAATVSHPADTIKTCMQGDLGNETYKGVIDTGKRLIQQSKLEGGYGMERFFSGLHWRIGRSILSIFVIMELMERITPVLYPDVFLSDDDDNYEKKVRNNRICSV